MSSEVQGNPAPNLKLTTPAWKTSPKKNRGQNRRTKNGGRNRNGAQPGKRDAPQRGGPKKAEMRELVAKLEIHCNDDCLIKGWEVSRRICNGRARSKLRGAARDVRAKAMLAAKSQRPETERRYFIAIRRLYFELAKAREQDFDSHLRDGLTWLKAKLGVEAQKQLGISGAAKASYPGCDDLLARLKTHRDSGHRGTAATRDLTKSTVCAANSRDACANLQKAPTLELELAYLNTVEKLCAELEKVGEPDFDGQLRTAVNFLENEGKRLCY